ncbi:phosphotransferase family protein [Nocardioides sp. GXZ039]|uniref:phosphotransferase family protein n=1 Tax=Nocardioides sp. GXZ039 TaxID=3136018 RepID=UPI0030F44EEA
MTAPPSSARPAHPPAASDVQPPDSWHELVRPDRIGPALAAATGEQAWLTPDVTLLSGGKSNLTFLVASAAGDLVLRRPPAGPLLPTAHDMAREARVQRALAASQVPVPRIVLTDDGELLGVPFYVMERVEGHIIRDELPAGYASTEEERRRLGLALVDTLADLHEVVPGEIGLGDYGRPEGFLDRQVRRWTDQWERSADEEVPAVTELGRLLAARIPASQRTGIVHGDYRLDNCVVSLSSPPHVNAVLDWELSTLGDPLADLALLLFYWLEPGETGLQLTPAVTDLAGFPTRAEVTARYASRSGADVSDLAFHEGLAHFKCAVITQGIAMRARSGAMAGQEFGDLSQEVRRIAERGLERFGSRS